MPQGRYFSQWQLLLEHPYRVRRELFVASGEDVYKRSLQRIIASTERFLELMLRDDCTFAETLSPEEIHRLIRISRLSMITQDFENVMQSSLYSPTKWSIIYSLETIEKNLLELVELLPSVQEYEQIIFPQYRSRDQWSIYLLSLTTGTLDCYFIGDTLHEEVRPTILKLFKVLWNKIPTTDFTMIRRLAVPSDSDQDPILMTLHIMVHLHQRSNYLDINGTMHLMFKRYLMWRAIAMHDNWLGKLKLEDMTLSTHPFYEKLFTYSDKRQIPKDVPFDENDPDNLGEVREKGWAPIDVLGDGNCGYYSLILGLESGEYW